jgi:hypothetical protein
MDNHLTIDKLKDLIHQSGFPFELKIAKKLSQLGFQIEVSHRFYDKAREKEGEIDIIARWKTILNTDDERTVSCVLDLVVECKNNSLPFICFGLDYNVKREPENIDNDAWYCKIRTSRDKGAPNIVSPFLFSGKDDIKSKHHQFIGQKRYFSLTSIERKDRTFKLHLPDELQRSISKLSAYIQSTDISWRTLSKDRELMEGKHLAFISVTFLTLIHSGKHYRFSIEDNMPEEAKITSVFLNNENSEGQVRFILDMVNEDALDDYIKQLKETFIAVAIKGGSKALSQKI